ncbi:polyhomeotic-like protein 1 isoform X9 [Takifugu flavidus]|uniref:polyhomeotic-like protein 1 isoform X9 n=1 Tax=Takifugu flavidus TaxID=433684 RepID=UPI00254468BB|nr:polyhomeotic-like protein 1 isoform X9 [Takifugu flavidus]
MEADGEQNQQRASTKASGPSSRKSTINSMSLYERQAVQALQALQRQPNAAQYFQQLMLQQQISNAQLQNLAAVQQATLAGTCQSIPFSNCSSSQTTSTTATTITSGSPTSNHPVCASAASTVSQSVLLNGTAGGQGQMYLRVNRSLRAPLSSQLIFMPGQAAAGAAATTVTKQPQAEPQEVTPTSDGHSDNHQVQYLAMRGVASSKGNSVKTEAPDRSDSATHSLVQPSSQSISTTKPAQPQSQAPHIRIPTYPQPTTLKSLPSSSRTPPSLCTSSIPLSQLLLHNTRTLTTGTTASSTTHTLLLTSSTTSHPNGYSVGTTNIKPAAKQLSGTLKRKSNSVSAIDEGGPSPAQLLPVRDQALNSPLESVFRGVCSQGGRPALPQAVVKPNILTHLIEGFVIHEGAEPFPICGSVKDSAGEELTDSPDNNQSEIVIRAKVLKCEYCKSFAPASQFKGTKRFCSMSCAKSMYWFPRYNISLRQNLSGRQGQSCALYHNPHKDNLSNSYEEGGLNKRRLPRRTSSEIASAKIAGRSIPGKATHSVQVPSQGHSEPSHSEEDTSGEEDDDLMSLSPASSASCHQPPPLIITENSAHSCLPMSPTEWSTKEVSKFIASLQGCEELASQFLSQEIDGQALLLLREEHLMSTMNIKLGPALKICAHINSLRD